MNKPSLKNIFLHFLYQIFIRVFAIIRPISIGVRVMLIQDDKVLMVKHSYQYEWYFPGGAVKKKETLEETARREAMEEAGATLGKMEFFGIYTNFFEKRSDHITVFLCRDFTFNKSHDWEIEDVVLFPLNALPENTAPGIRRRVEDYLAEVNPKDGFGKW